MSKTDVIKALQTKADQVAYATQLLSDKTRDWQVIKAYISNRLSEMPLTDEQKKKLDRYQFIYNHLVSGKYSEQEVINMNMKVYGIQLAQAYEDIACTKEVFTSVINISKRFDLKMELEAAKRMRIKCEMLNDYKTAAMYTKIITEIYKQIPDEEENPAELFEGHKIEATFDPALLGGAPQSIDMGALLKKINDKRGVKIKTELFEEIQSEPVQNENS